MVWGAAGSSDPAARRPWRAPAACCARFPEHARAGVDVGGRARKQCWGRWRVAFGCRQMDWATRCWLQARALHGWATSKVARLRPDCMGAVHWIRALGMWHVLDMMQWHQKAPFQRSSVSDRCRGPMLMLGLEPLLASFRHSLWALWARRRPVEGWNGHRTPPRRNAEGRMTLCTLLPRFGAREGAHPPP